MRLPEAVLGTSNQNRYCPLCLTTLLSSFLVHISTLGLFRWIYPKTAIVILLEHIHKKFEKKWTKIKGCCQLGRKVVTHNSKSDLPLDCQSKNWKIMRKIKKNASISMCTALVARWGWNIMCSFEEETTCVGVYLWGLKRPG